MPSSALRIIAAGVLTALVASGCSGGGAATPLTLAQMRQDLARVPIPSGATLFADYEHPRRGPTAGGISRYYRYSGAAHPLCRVLLEAAAHAGYAILATDGRPVAPDTCRTSPAYRALGPQAGVVQLRPHDGTTIRLGWAESEGIQVSVSDTAG